MGGIPEREEKEVINLNNIKEDNRKNEVIINFNRKFYSNESISKTMKAFKDVCFCSFNDFSVSLKPKEKLDKKELALEFYNYCLGVMK